MKAAASIFNARLFVVKQATLIVPNLAEEDRNRCRYDYHGFDHDAHVDAFNQIYRIIDEEIDTRYVIDATQVSGIPEYFYDHVHPTKRGSNAIAKIVAQSLQSELVALDDR
jgi:lysophospholipase L1-like esterase